MPIKTPPGKRLFTSKHRYQQQLAKVRPAEDFQLNSKTIPIDPENFFGPTKKFKSYSDIHTIYSIDDGEIALPSGIIGIGELNSDSGGFFPFEYQVKPGVYRIEKGIDQLWQHGIGVRIHFDESNPAVRYAPANFIESNNHLLARKKQRAIALFDAQSMTDITSREVEYWGHRYRYEIDQKCRQAPKGVYHKTSWTLNPRNQLSPSSKQADMVTVFDQNFRAKLCFWGISDDGKIVSLVVVDGGKYCEPVYETLSFDWDSTKAGLVDVPQFKKLALEVSISEKFVLSIRGTKRPFFLDAEWIEITNASGYSVRTHLYVGNSHFPYKKQVSSPYQSSVYKVKLRFATGYKLAFTQP